jgi:hypothetical protein
LPPVVIVRNFVRGVAATAVNTGEGHRQRSRCWRLLVTIEPRINPMKRSVSKLHLDRQLIRPLTELGLRGVVGGGLNPTKSACHVECFGAPPIER